jgi:ActR/RegA family two-component response regulator
MIYLIDEDFIELRSFVLELKLRGFEVQQLLDADEAYVRLKEESNIELAIIDVMLSTAESSSSRYDRIQTNNFVTTGLSLLKDLSSDNPLCFPKKAVLFSHASIPTLVQKIQKVSDDCKIQYLDKNDYDNPYDFANEIEEIIKKVNS